VHGRWRQGRVPDAERCGGQEGLRRVWKEASDHAQGKGGSTYGVAPFDYLTGVGKRANTDSKTYKTDSGYGEAKGSYKTELWDRVKKPAPGAEVYDQWTHNWSPKFGTTLVAGADANQGKPTTTPTASPAMAG
jgi:hypothetical protein